MSHFIPAAKSWPSGWNFPQHLQEPGAPDLLFLAPHIFLTPYSNFQNFYLKRPKIQCSSTVCRNLYPGSISVAPGLKQDLPSSLEVGNWSFRYKSVPETGSYVPNSRFSILLAATIFQSIFFTSWVLFLEVNKLECIKSSLSAEECQFLMGLIPPLLFPEFKEAHGVSC